MAFALTSRRAIADPIEAARLHFVLRFSFGTTAAFTICEFMGWQPSALAPILTGVLLANLPAPPPLKVGLALVIMMGLWAWLAFILTTFLQQTPHILFGLVGLILFVAFFGLAQGKAQLPLTLLLVCFAVVPVMTLTFPQNADRLASVFTRAMVLAVTFVWIAFAVWPRPSPKASSPPTAPLDSPLLAALLGVAIVLPLMLIYWLFGLFDAMPVLLTTTLLVGKMEEERSAATASAKLVGNFLGGFIAIVAYLLLGAMPTLTTLALISFLIGVGFALQIVKGGVRGGNAVLAYNATMLIFGILILKGPANSGAWVSRMLQFGIASIFAIGMISLFWPLLKSRAAR